ncbi:MAG: hypothetical protein LIP01_13705 [Tannerellaceae bacterium]|nr:hypothetical protein [Tannerellaceae bacterium]
MNQATKNIIWIILGVICLVSACKHENDFYFAGKQPVYLLYPAQDTAWVLDYQKPDTLYRFNWESKRNFIYFDLVFSFSEDLEENRTEVFTGFTRDYFMTTMQLDTLLSEMGVEIGQKPNYSGP